MGDVYMYADETGNLDYDVEGKGSGASAYFGFGTIVFNGPHPEALWAGFDLRTRLTQSGLILPKGFHAKDDNHAVRAQVFELIRRLGPRIDTTFLCKANAYSSIRQAGEMRLYKMAWYLHFKEIATQVSHANDTLHVIAGSFGTKKRAAQARTALDDVCKQVHRTIHLSVWDAPTSVGLQLADYATWSVQRVLHGGRNSWHDTHVKPTLHSVFMPWGEAR